MLLCTGPPGHTLSWPTRRHTEGVRPDSPVCPPGDRPFRAGGGEPAGACKAISRPAASSSRKLWMHRPPPPPAECRRWGGEAGQGSPPVWALASPLGSPLTDRGCWGGRQGLGLRGRPSLLVAGAPPLPACLRGPAHPRCLLAVLCRCRGDEAPSPVRCPALAPGLPGPGEVGAGPARGVVPTLQGPRPCVRLVCVGRTSPRSPPPQRAWLPGVCLMPPCLSEAGLSPVGAPQRPLPIPLPSPLSTGGLRGRAPRRSQWRWVSSEGRRGRRLLPLTRRPLALASGRRGAGTLTCFPIPQAHL